MFYRKRLERSAGQNYFFSHFRANQISVAAIFNNPGTNVNVGCPHKQTINCINNYNESISVFSIRMSLLYGWQIRVSEPGKVYTFTLKNEPNMYWKRNYMSIRYEGLVWTEVHGNYTLHNPTQRHLQLQVTVVEHESPFLCVCGRESYSLSVFLSWASVWWSQTDPYCQS